MDPGSLAQPLLRTLLYEQQHRPCHDQAWRGAYVCLLAATLLAGLVSLLQNLSQLPILTDPGYLEDPANCPYPGPYPELNSTLGQGHAAWDSTSQLRSLQQGPDDPNPAPPAWLLLSSSAQILGSSCSVALALALCYSALLLRRPSVAVAVAVGGQVLGPMAAGMYLMYTGFSTAAYCCLLLSAALALCCYLHAEAIGQLPQLLAVASDTLSSNPALPQLSLCTKLATLGLVTCICGGCLVASLDGQAYPNPLRVPEAGVHCISPKGVLVQCCLWQYNAWPLAYLPVAVIAALWTLLLGTQVEVFAVSDTIGQWYFRPVSSAAAPGCPRTALRHALGPSLGSLSLAALVLTAVAHIRLVFGRFHKQRQGQGVLGALCGCCISCLLHLLHLLTKFTTVYMSMAGSSFFQSGRDAAQLLHRTAAPCVAMWWLPPTVLQLPSLLVALGLACSAFNAAHSQWVGLRQEALLLASLLLASLCGLLCWLLLSFTASLLLLVLDALLLCYASDRDACICSQPQVHAAYDQLAALCDTDPSSPLQQQRGPSHPIPQPLVLLPSDSFPYAVHLRGGTSHAEPYSTHLHSPPSSLGEPVAGSSHTTLQGAWLYPHPPRSLSLQPGGGQPPMFGQHMQRASYSSPFASQPGPSSSSMLYPPGFQAMLPSSHSGAAAPLPSLGASSSGLFAPTLGAEAGPPSGTTSHASLQPALATGLSQLSHGGLGMSPFLTAASTSSASRPLLMPLGPSPLVYTPSFQLPGNLAAEVPAGEDTASLLQ